MGAIAWTLVLACDWFAPESTRVVLLGGDTVPVVDVKSSDGMNLVAGLPGGGSRSFAVDEIESVAWSPSEGTPPGLTPVAGRLWLRSGIDLPIELSGGDAHVIHVKSAFGDALDFPWIRVHAVRSTQLSGEESSMFEAARAEPLDTQDILLARDRQTKKVTRLSLHVLGMAEDGVRVDFRGERTVPMSQIVGIVFGKENGAAVPPLAPPTITVRYASGITGHPPYGGKLEALDSHQLRIRLADGPAITIPRHLLAGFSVRSSRVAWLSALEPVAVEQTAALDIQPLFLRDAAPDGPGLMLGPRQFARGLCAMPRTRVTYTMQPGTFDVFEATIGIDERSSGPADAIFRILLDGTVVLQREHVRHGTAEDIRVPLGTAKSLTLEVDFGDNFDLGDHCVFAGARLLKL